MLHALQNTNVTRNGIRQNPEMDLLTFFSNEQANYPRMILYHHKVGFIRADLLENRKLEGFVNQTSPAPLCPCRHTLFSNLAPSPEASSECLNRNKLLVVPSRSLQEVLLFNILETRLFGPCSPQQSLSLQPATGSPGVVSPPATPPMEGPHAQHSSLPARRSNILHPASCYQDKANRQVPPARPPTPL